MDRPLLKLYIVITFALALAILFVPGVIVRTAGWINSAFTRLKLYAYQYDDSLPADNEGKDKAKAIIILDDGWETQFTNGYRILGQYGYKGCIGVVPAAIGTTGYMDYEQLAELYMQGWDLLNHTYNHANLVKLPKDRQLEQVNRARDWLNQHGFNRGSDIVAYPQGEYDKELEKTLQAEGYAAARSLRSLWSGRAGGTLEDVEILNVISAMPFKRVMEAIDKAINNKSTVIILLHKIEPVTDETQMQVDERTFQSIVEYLAKHEKQISVMTLTEFLSLQAEQPAL